MGSGTSRSTSRFAPPASTSWTRRANVFGAASARASLRRSPPSCASARPKLCASASRPGSSRPGSAMRWPRPACRSCAWTHATPKRCCRSGPIKPMPNECRRLGAVAAHRLFSRGQAKSWQSMLVRNLITARRQLVRTQVDLANQLRGILRTFGLALPPGSGGGRRFEAAVRERAAMRPGLSLIILPLLDRGSRCARAVGRCARQGGGRRGTPGPTLSTPKETPNNGGVGDGMAAAA